MFRLKIKMGNEAMNHPNEVADALVLLARDLKDYSREDASGSIHDENGNHVGEWSLNFKGIRKAA